ncbi:MAG: leucine--tRNA ligase [Elusimicrobia bacterium]|nr:leucine--tRNA ligase [Elusimicrobiota bacterium]
MPHFQDIDRKQQNEWYAGALFKTPALPGAKKFYCLDMFPYPSGEGLHVGHPEGYTASDILCRYKRMRGFDVLHPMGWDAFGLPAENYAISTGVHPELTTNRNCENFKRQIKSLGFSYDWDREINTTSPGYYRWTQWIFLELFKKGLAFEATMPINWCPECKTGLANEEVFQGRCERCETPIEKKSLKQWMLRITAYADRLLDDLDGLDWPHSTTAMQKNWIGRSEGAEIDFRIDGRDEIIKVFTTRPDTLYGATYLVLSPEHGAVSDISAPDRLGAVKAYIAAAAGKSDLERTEEKEKTGVFTGAYALNPASGARIPVWTADYVLTTYGTGAIMAVPAHDERDREFAEKFGLPIIQVVAPMPGQSPVASRQSPVAGQAGGGDGPALDKAFCDEGVSVNSELINGLKTPDAKKKIISWLQEKRLGRAKVNFKLRDWVFSRQRYWGEPIPIVHCDKCGAVPVNESDLPVLLPKAEKYLPTGTGQSPLAVMEDWVRTKCPKCGAPGRRETNTMPQWAGSCWYYLRFTDPKNADAFVSPAAEKAWLPVDLYIGGAEHAVLHLLYARFWHKVLYDLGYVSTKEPFKKLVHQGMILSYAYRDSKGVYRNYEELDIREAGLAVTEEGEQLRPAVEKMSKSKKNVINPDDILKKYGADAFRMYEMFMGPLEDVKPWDMRGIEGIYRFLKRAWVWAAPRPSALGQSQVTGHRPQATRAQDGEEKNPGFQPSALSLQPDKDLELIRNQTIAKVTDDLESLKFNTAISALMIYLNKLAGKESAAPLDLKVFLALLHPFAPHITDELWMMNGGNSSLLSESWPSADFAVLAARRIEIPVQVNGRVKARIFAGESADEETLKKMAFESVAKQLEGKTILKTIVVPKRLVSIVVKRRT